MGVFKIFFKSKLIKLLLCLEYTLDSLEMQQMNIVDAVSNSTTNDDDIEESCVRYNFKFQDMKCP